MKKDNPNLYKHGLPFSQCLADNILDQKKRVLEQGKCSMIIIDGNAGEGKTTLGVEIADFLQGEEIVFKDQLALGGVDFSNKIKQGYLNKRIVIVYDEAGDFDRRGALSRFNKFINRIFDTYRAYKVIVVLCLPRFWVLDQTIFDKGFPRLMIHCYDRSNKDGNFSGYSLPAMQYMLWNTKKTPIKSRCYSNQTPNFRGHFLNLRPERIKELDKYSIGGKLSIIDNAHNKHEGLSTKKEVEDRLGIAPHTLERTIKDLRIKPVAYDKGPGKKSLYNTEQVNLIMSTQLKKRLSGRQPKNEEED